MQERGIRVDPERWLDRCLAAEAEFVLDDTKQGRDRLQNLRTYRDDVYTQALVGRVRGTGSVP